MKEKKKYVLVSMELVYLDSADVITTSGEDDYREYDPNGWA